MDPSKIREKICRFRILIIGRANAGKTTILQRVCNTRDNPEIRNGAGRLIDPALLEASMECGEHDIENEMVFQSNPGFIFHDSRGFEAGGESEFDQVKAFIARRSKETKLKNQLHAIWYCIPMNEAHRAFTEGEVKFFSQCDTGSIPVIVLFTKFDALYDIEFAQLRENKIPWKEAKELAPKYAKESFDDGSQLKFLYHSKDIRHPPKCHVCLPNMDKDDADCGSLIERTAETLDNEVLQQLFVSTQQTNLELCMKYAIERALLNNSEDHQRIMRQSVVWFPHLSMDLLTAYNFAFNAYLRFFRLTDFTARDNNARYARRYAANNVRIELDIRVVKTEIVHSEHCEEMQSRILAVASGSSPLEDIVQLISAAVIIFEHSFYIYDKRRHLQDQQESAPSYIVALELYMASPHAAAVRETVRAAVQVYEEATKAPAHTYKGNLPAWMAKLLFERSEKKEMAKARLIKTVQEITLEHRLPRP